MERLAVITDIHGNIPAPQAVLGRIEEWASRRCCADATSSGTGRTPPRSAI
jgi:hypothetical protein